jgi:hypothetical protein
MSKTIIQGCFFNIEWNAYNGFVIQILHLDMNRPINIDSALFGLNFCKSFLYVDFLFIHFKVFDKSQY